MGKIFYVEDSYSDSVLVHSFILTGLDTYYRLPTKLWEGNVFSHVCLFTGVVVVPCDHYIWCIGPHCMRTPPSPSPCPAPSLPARRPVRLVSRQLASYWNAFLFETLFRVVKLLDTLPRTGHLPRPDRPSVPALWTSPANRTLYQRCPETLPLWWQNSLFLEADDLT